MLGPWRYVIFIVWFLCGFYGNVFAEKPNFLILLADDLGIGDIGCFGNDTIRTPNIDSLCTDGVKLSQHLAAASVCTPSRAALMTGRYPIRQGMASYANIPVFITPASWSGLPGNETTFARKLQASGYKTGLIGKWHLGVHCEQRGDYCHFPTRHGFDYFFGTPMTNHRGLNPKKDSVVWHRFPRLKSIIISVISAGILGAAFLWSKGARKTAIIFGILFAFPPLWFWIQVENSHILGSGFWRNEELVEQPINFNRMTQRLVNEGVNFLKQRQNDDEPFLLMMSWLQPHTYLHSEAPFKGSSKHGRYGDDVEEMDWSVGEMLKALKKYGFEDNTLVYFSSDNGGHIEEVESDNPRAGGHNGIYKGSKFQGGQDGGIRMPTAIRFPGHIKPGIEISEPTSQMDILPTFLNLAGAKIPDDRVIDGRDMMPLVKGETEISAHQFLFHYCCMEIHSIRYRPEKGTATYKLHLYWPDWEGESTGCHSRMACGCYDEHYKLDPPRLFNLAEDPSEDNPLDVNVPEYKEMIKLMLDAKIRHQNSGISVETQFSLKYSFYRPWLQHCCNFPLCHCTDPNNALDIKHL